MSKSKKIDKTENIKLEQKLSTDSNFKNQMNKAKIITQQLLQRALYTNLDCIHANLLYKFFEDNQQIIYFYFGMFHPTKQLSTHKNQNINSQNKTLQKLSMYLLKKLKIADKFYTIIFFNQLADSNAYNQLKNVLMCFSFEYFKYLNKFILVQPSFYHKASNSMFSFNTLNKYLKNKSINVQNCQQLSEKIYFPLQEIILCLPQQIVSQQFPEKIVKLQKKKSPYQEQNKPIQPKMFKNLLIPSQTAKIQKKQLNQYTLNDFGVPVLFENLILYMQASQKGLLQQGIFRKSVSIDQQNQALTQINNNNFDYLTTIQNPHIVANIIKRFLANLKTPIIPYESYKLMMHDQGIVDKIKFYKQIIQDIPNVNYQTLAFLVKFLKEDVISKQKLNKMPSKNISICFTPCLMRFQTPSIADMLFATKSASAMQIIINKYQQIFDERKQEEIAHISFIQSKKSFVRESLNLNLNSGFFRNSRQLQQGQTIFKQPGLNQKIQNSLPSMTKSTIKSSKINPFCAEENYQIDIDRLSRHHSANNVNQTLKTKISYKNNFQQEIYQNQNQNKFQKEYKKIKTEIYSPQEGKLQKLQVQKPLLKKQESSTNEQEFKKKISFDLKFQNNEQNKQIQAVTRSRLACRVNTIQSEQIYKSKFKQSNENNLKNEKQSMIKSQYGQVKIEEIQIQHQKFNNKEQNKKVMQNQQWLLHLQKGKQLEESFIRVSYLDEDPSDKFQILDVGQLDQQKQEEIRHTPNFSKQ